MAELVPFCLSGLRKGDIQVVLKILTLCVLSLTAIVTGFDASRAATTQEEVGQAIEGVELPALPPGEAPVYHVGDRFKIVHHGEEAYHEVIAVKDGFVTFKASYGCEWRKRDLFSPPVEWHDCDGRSGTQTILATQGSPWPLVAGKTFSYTIKGSDSQGNSWKTVQRCKVEGMYSISIDTGEHKTYKVVCVDDFLRQTWYWSPVLREWVKYLRTEKKEEMCNTDLLSIDAADVLNLVSKKKK
ncbi:MAG TPA: hypothetical protein ENJ57_04615 [Rhizobiales bacterium]|nr:hypothetical protein [Hyphomicrobiales bacterium]